MAAGGAPGVRAPLLLAPLLLASFAGCFHGEDPATLVLELRIPVYFRTWGFEHMFVNITNIEVEATDGFVANLTPAKRQVDLKDDLDIYNGPLRPALYKRFDIYVERVVGILEDGEVVEIQTRPFPGRHHVSRDPGDEVAVVKDSRVRFQIDSVLEKEGTEFVWV